MVNPNLKNNPTNNQRNQPSLNREQYARLMAEAKAPYRGLRKMIYVAFGASGFIGALVFLAQLAAGRNVTTALPNFALQIGVVALMIWLFRWEQGIGNRRVKDQKNRGTGENIGQ